MKIRKDFVTNSSSSSFILAFKDKEDMNQFKEDCNFLDYEQETIINMLFPPFQVSYSTCSSTPSRMTISHHDSPYRK